MSALRYGWADYDHNKGVVNQYVKMPMDGVDDGDVSLPQFLQSAAEHGWRLCGTVPNAAHKGAQVGLSPDEAKRAGKSTRTVQDAAELTVLIFLKDA
jgi:hypothetical protein